MKTYLTTLSCVLCLFFAGALMAEIPADADATTKILGKWTMPDGQIPGIKEGGFDFKADGTFTSYAVIKIQEQELRVEVEGTWKIEKGLLIEEITKTSEARMVPVGAISKDAVLILDDKECRTRTEKGMESSMFREKPAEAK